MNTPTPTETLLGGKKVSAAKKDGTAEDVFVRQIGIEDCPAYLELQDDELSIIEFVAQKPAGWAKTLTPSCQEQLLEESERINADFFSRWVDRQKKRADKLMPGIVEKKIAALSVLPISPPKPPLSAASA
jgi:hypothetical protein